MGIQKKPARYKNGLILTKDNQLTRIHGNMTPLSYKLLNYILWASNNENRITDIKIQFPEIVRQLSIKITMRGDYIKQECTKAAGTTVEIQNPNDSEKMIAMPLVTSIEYDHGKITANVNPEIVPYIKNLRGNFTPVELQTLGRCSSYPAMRLYEVCLSWKRAGKVTYSVNEWKGLLGATKDAYNAFSQFKRRVWLPSVNYVNHQSNLYLIPSYLKDGRTVAKITVHITENEIVDVPAMSEPQKLVENTTKSVAASLRMSDCAERVEDVEETPDTSSVVFRKMVDLGFSKKLAQDYLSKYGEKYCTSQVAITLASKRSGQMQNPAGFLRCALEEDFAGQRAEEAAIIEREKQHEKQKQQRELDAWHAVHGKPEFPTPKTEIEKPMPKADEEAAKHWKEITESIDLPHLAIEKWLASCVPIAVKDDTLVVVAPNDLTRDWIKDRYSAKLTEAASAFGLRAVECIVNGQQE